MIIEVPYIKDSSQNFPWISMLFDCFVVGAPASITAADRLFQYLIELFSNANLRKWGPGLEFWSLDRLCHSMHDFLINDQELGSENALKNRLVFSVSLTFWSLYPWRRLKIFVAFFWIFKGRLQVIFCIITIWWIHIWEVTH